MALCETSFPTELEEFNVADGCGKRKRTPSKMNVFGLRVTVAPGAILATVIL